MARPTPQTQAKRQREQAKRDKRRVKDERKAARKAAKESPADGIQPATPSPVAGQSGN
jgi:hypothetical protein